MPLSDYGAPVTEDRRREIYAALVEAQDREIPVPLSRAGVANRFGISAAQLRDIEGEGLEKDWPPL